MYEVSSPRLTVQNCSATETRANFMEVDTAQEAFLDSGQTPPPLSPGPLALLLDDEYFLLQIFRCLVDYGLQECRLVCRKWREVCQQIPVSLSWIDPRNLSATLSQFPSAVSLSTNADVRYGLAEVDRAPRLGYAFSDLPLFRRLQSLTLHIEQLPAQACYHSFLQSVKQLTSLRLITDSHIISTNLYSSLSCLTNLTLLELNVWFDDQQDISPLTNLSKIRDLELGCDLFMSAEGRLMFPSLTNLTRLAFVDDIFPHGYDFRRFLKVISKYSASLKCFGITVPDQEMMVEEDWTLLKTLRHLEALRIQDLVTLDSHFFGAVRKLNSLTKLDIRWFRLNDFSLSNSIFSLTTLKSLRLQEIEEDNCDDAPWRDISRLSLLTQLTVGGGHLGEPLKHLTKLVHLEMDVFCSRSVNLDEALPFLRNLETIVIRSRNAVRVSHKALSKLNQLKALSFELVGVDERFFGSLVGALGLTELYFQSDLEELFTFDFLSQVNDLRSLECLTLRCGAQCSPSEYLLPSCLSKLKSLEVQDAIDQERHKLRRMFPHLRQLKTEVFLDSV